MITRTYQVVGMFEFEKERFVIGRNFTRCVSEGMGMHVVMRNPGGVVPTVGHFFVMEVPESGGQWKFLRRTIKPK